MLVILAAAVAAAPFSGVTLDNLLDEPIRSEQVLFEAAGAQLLELGAGMAAGPRGVVTAADFRLDLTRDLPAGLVQLKVTAVAPSRGTDSLWVEVDGQRQATALPLPVETPGERLAVVTIAAAGRHTIGLRLREGAGSELLAVALARVTITVPRPPLRAELQGQHPRLLFGPDDVARLRARLQDPAVQRFYTPAPLLTGQPPAYREGRRNGGAFRRLPGYALSQLLQPQDEQLAAIVTWLEAATAYPHCGVDLDAEYFTEGVALAYDWLYDSLPADLRKRVRDTLARQCREVYEASLQHRQGGGLSFQQNHYWFAHLALALGAAAIHGEVPEAETWLAWAWDRLERVALSLGPDGSFHEGPGYFDFSMPTLYLLVDLYERCTGLPLPAGHEGLRGLAEFRFHHLFPGLARCAALEDTGVGHGRPPVRVLLWEAKRFQSPVAQGLADRLIGNPSTDPHHLLCLDERLTAADPRAAVPLARRYRDVETALARSSWNDDATWLGFVSRPLGGQQYAALCARYQIGGTGHNHPAQNHFLLYGRGEVLAGDPGYTYEKRTRNHNTILVDGQGQLGDGEMWPVPNAGRAHLTGFATQGDVTIVTGDATSAYPAALGLERFERTVVLAGRDLVVVRDRLAAQEPRTFSWLLHHWGTSVRHGAGYRVTRGQAQLDVVPLQPADLTTSDTRYRPNFIHPTRDLTPKEPDVSLLELQTKPVREADLLVVLQVADAGQDPPAVRDVSTATALAVAVGGTTVAFRRGAGELRLDGPADATYAGAARTVVLRAGQPPVEERAEP